MFQTRVALIAIAILTIALLVTCHEEEKKDDEHHAPQHVHTIHHHHVKKYTIVKKYENQKIKEVPVPYKVYHIEKVPYKYYVHPLIVKVPLEYFHTKHEDFDKHTKHEEKKDEHHHDDDVVEHQYDDYVQSTPVGGRRSSAFK